MANAHHRKKAPDEVRRRLLEAGISLAARSGVDAVTVEAVSHLAGVSRGGFQHHFPSRRALLDAAFDEIWGGFHEAWESCVRRDDEPTGRLSRAYLHTNDAAHAEEMRDLSLACLSFALGDAEFRRRWSERTSELLPADEAETLQGQARLLICRFAADGIWLAELLGVHAPSPELRAEMMRQLDELTKQRDPVPASPPRPGRGRRRRTLTEPVRPATGPSIDESPTSDRPSDPEGGDIPIIREWRPCPNDDSQDPRRKAR